MPIYEYECPTHGRYEVQQRITEDALTSCTVEGCGQPVRKLISSTSFALKGSGWYATDYGGKSGKSDAKAAEAKPAEAKPAESNPAESKPAGGCGRPECGTGACAAAAA